jgi:hypothetical protein
MAMVVLAAPARSARAAPPITRNDYTVEIFQGPLTAPNRVVGVGGAITAAPEGVSGMYANAASPAVRDPYSLRWFDWDLSGSISFPGAFSRSDFENRGETATRTRAFGDFLLLNLAGAVQLGPLGVAAAADLQQINLLAQRPEAPGIDLRIARWKLLAAHSFFDGQLAVGGGIRAITMQIADSGFFNNLQIARPAFVGSSILTMSGLAPEFGVLVRPNDALYRFGATYRGPVTGRTLRSDLATVDDAGVLRFDTKVLPDAVTLPWELEFGVAVQLGRRPFNPRWFNPHEDEEYLAKRIRESRARRERQRQTRVAHASTEDAAALGPVEDRDEERVRTIEALEADAWSERLVRVRRARYQNWPREYVRLLFAVVVTGSSDNAVAVQSFLDQERIPFGRDLSLSIRGGIETEPIFDRMKVRIGSYLEPSRWEGGSSRAHATFGGDIKLFRFSPWNVLGDTVLSASWMLDLAPRYTNWGVGIGTWY